MLHAPGAPGVGSGEGTGEVGRGWGVWRGGRPGAGSSRTRKPNNQSTRGDFPHLAEVAALPGSPVGRQDGSIRAQQ